MPYLHRYLGGWLPGDPTGRRLHAALRDIEQRRIADGCLAPVGLQLVAQPARAATHEPEHANRERDAQAVPSVKTTPYDTTTT
jgi:hypothetical protein